MRTTMNAAHSSGGKKKQLPIACELWQIFLGPHSCFFPPLFLSLNHAFPMRSKTCKHKQTQLQQNTHQKKKKKKTARTHKQRQTPAQVSVYPTARNNLHLKQVPENIVVLLLLLHTPFSNKQRFLSSFSICGLSLCVFVFWGLLASKTNKKLWLLVSVNCDATH